MKITADILQEYISGSLSMTDRERVERAIRDDRETATTLEMMRSGSEVIRSRFELDPAIPPDWIGILSRWKPPTCS